MLDGGSSLVVVISPVVVFILKNLTSSSMPRNEYLRSALLPKSRSVAVNCKIEELVAVLNSRRTAVVEGHLGALSLTSSTMIVSYRKMIIQMCACDDHMYVYVTAHA